MGHRRGRGMSLREEGEEDWEEEGEEGKGDIISHGLE